MAPEVPLPLRIAQTFSLTTTSILAGSNLAISLLTIPRLLESPTPLILRQWTHLYHVGKTSFPPIGILSASTFFYLASKVSSGSLGPVSDSKFYGYIVAGVLNVVMVPYTVLCMKGTNDKLLGKEEEMRGLGVLEKVTEVGVKKGESAHELVDWWGVLNLGRSAFLVGAAVVGAWTVVN